MFEKYTLLLGVVLFGTAPLGAAPAVSTATLPSAVSEMKRFPSPSGQYAVVFVPLPKDWTHVQKAVHGAVREATELYAVTFYRAQSNQPLNVMYFADEGAPPPPEDLLPTLRWSPGEKYVVMPDKIKARENNHVFQLVAPLDRHQAWRLECDHVRWIDDSRLVGDLNTAEMPGGILKFDGNAGQAELLQPPDGSLGYQIASVAGARVTVKQFLHEPADAKVKWDTFIPACLEIDLDTLKKRSVACPKE